MEIKQVIAATFFACAAGFANATVINVNSLNPLPEDYLYSKTVSHTPGLFTDTFNFILDDHLTTDWLAIAPTVNSPLGIVLSISNFEVDLFKQGDLLPLSNNAMTGTYGLDAGTYYFQVTGTADGAMGGVYSLKITTVPEPETLALTLLGIGLMGTVLRRRQTTLPH